MKFVIQRVTSAKVEIEGKIAGQIDRGFMVLIGCCGDDTEQTADKMIKKMIGLRIFEDEQGKTNLSLASVGGSLLLVSQFTLYADIKHGNRPGFTRSGDPAHAERLYDYIVSSCRSSCPDMKIETGEFGADMKVSLVNDGPFTVIMDSDEL